MLVTRERLTVRGCERRESPLGYNDVLVPGGLKTKSFTDSGDRVANVTTKSLEGDSKIFTTKNGHLNILETYFSKTFETS